MNRVGPYFKFSSSKWFLTLSLFFGLFACLGNSVSYQETIKTFQTELVYNSKSETKNPISFQKKSSKFIDDRSVYNSIQLRCLSSSYGNCIEVKLLLNSELILSFDTPCKFFQTKTISQTSDEDHFLLV